MATVSLRSAYCSPPDHPILKYAIKRAVVFGSEGAGLCEHTLSKSDHVAIIPMHNNVDSLKVAASSAVALYKLFSK